ncbi:uncharacterized protein EDB91DRAFT_1249762 [Suillus paluster]|uniref:uncharacterized protein n=1 Tax=Suillus paluster TaxID=48578 RepID=UPI001B86CA7A|nr:uncharacterized protein EDB91DRAFT_1249762 [Suillus paluster]KAG1737113.1 hypothetical protein EDB91DRAFT_1249762 [Suillus paluster]
MGAVHPNHNVAPALGLPLEDLPLPHQLPSPPRDVSPPPPDFSPPPPDFSPPPPNFSPPPPELSLPPQSSPVPMAGDEDPNPPEAEFMDASGQYYHTYHSLLNGKYIPVCGRPCTADGVFLPPGMPPTLPPPKSPHDWSPYRNDVEFATAEFTFKQCHMSHAALDFLFDLMAATLAKHDDSPPFVDHKDLHKVIDAAELGNVPWQCLSVQDPRLMAHNMLANPTYKGEIDYVPFREYDASDNTRQWKDFMSGDHIMQ